MDASYTASESKIKTEDVRDAVYEARTGALKAVGSLWRRIVRLETICGILIVSFLGAALFLVMEVTGYRHFAEGVSQFAGETAGSVVTLEGETQFLQRRVSALEKMAEATPVAEVSAGVVVETPAPTAPVPTEAPVPTATPAPNTSGYVEAWCSSGEPKWLPEGGNPTTAYVAWAGEPTSKIRVVGPEVDFEAETMQGVANLAGLEDAVRGITRERYAQYLIVCKSYDPYKYELQMIRLDGVQVWPAEEKVATAMPTITATPRAPIPTATPTPRVRYVNVDSREWEVAFERKYIVKKSAVDDLSKWIHLEGAFYTVATCSYQDLEDIKRVLDNHSIGGTGVTFELTHRWGREFLTEVGYGEFWRTCTDWFTENGGGFDW